MKFIEPYKKNSQKSDEELLKEFISSGKIDLLGDLYSRYMHLVYGVCLKYLKEREESKDAVLHIFEKLVIEIPRHNIENFKNWLHVVTKNYCLMQLRTDKTQKEKLEEWINDTVVFMEYNQNLHPIDEDGDTLEKGLEDCIERLNGEQKECIRQFYYENRCYNEIALNLDLEEKKVKSHLQNAKRNLKLCLEEKHVGQE